MSTHTTPKYNVEILDTHGNVANRNVRVTLNGKDYDSLLSPRSYTLNVLNLLTGESKNHPIKIVKRITSNKDLTMYYGAGKSYTVRVYDDNGNVANKVPVTFKVNGKTYTRYTNANGYASFKISLYPKTYSITATYKGFTVKNKITVKTTLITKNVAVKKGKTIKFTVKLLNSKGKILKYKKVKIKFKGRSYWVKTNNKGIGTLKINKKYNVGKYAIQTTYGKLTVKNTVQINK